MKNLPTPTLAPDYYLTNFRFLLDWVWSRYADLLSEDEQYFIQTFNQLERDAQCLLVRLSSRKGPLFRRDKLHYDEIIALDAAAQQLIDARLLHHHFPLSVQELAAALTKPELLKLFGDQLSGVKLARKETLVQQLATEFTAQRSWQEWTQNQLGSAWYLDNQPIIRTLLLLFFGNAYQDLTEFVLQDLGLYRYENYPIDHQHRIFKNRAELEQYQHLINLRDLFDAESSPEALTQLAAQLSIVNNTALNNSAITTTSVITTTNERLERRRAKFCNQLAYELERINEHALALQLYEQSHLPPARERRVRLLEKQGKYAESWELLNLLLNQPFNEQELQVAQRIAPRLAKKLNIQIEKVLPVATTSHYLELTPLIDDQGDLLRVEEVVRVLLDTEDAPCVYAENALLCGLFGLWLWPEMFRGVEGAFANPFQAAPLDLYQENFVTNRPGINALWESLDSGQYCQALRTTWSEKQGIANHFVNWAFLTEELLDLALASIPAQHLKLIFKRLMFDIKNNRSGLPDLIQFYPQQNTYRLVEVKGPGDRLQDNQQRWLKYFAQHQIPAEVYYVSWK
jgi:hypothetical protein